MSLCIKNFRVVHNYSNYYIHQWFCLLLQHFLCPPTSLFWYPSIFWDIHISHSESLFKINVITLFIFAALKHSPSKRGKRDSIKKIVQDKSEKVAAELNANGNQSSSEAGLAVASTSNANSSPPQPSNGKLKLIFLWRWMGIVIMVSGNMSIFIALI